MRNPDSMQMQSLLSKVYAGMYIPCSTGLPFLDEMLEGGLAVQSVLLLTSALGMGKTALCQKMADSIAQTKRKVVCVNYEMNKEQLWARAFSCRLLMEKGCRIPMTRFLRNENWTQKEVTKINDMAKELDQLSIYLTYNPNSVKEDLKSLLEYLEQIGKESQKRGERAPVVFVDCLQLISVSSCQNKTERITRILLGLKSYAKRYDSSVVAVMTSDRECTPDRLEYAGDMVLSLNDDRIGCMAGDSDTNVRKLELKVEQSNFTASGQSIILMFDAACSAIWDASLAENEGKKESDDAKSDDEEQNTKECS